MSKYYKLRRDSSNCHVFEFSPNELRLDATIGKTKKLERLSKITGEPKAGEYAVAKLNGGFFAMNGSTEYIGTFVDEGLYYQGSSYYYPTLVYWKADNRLTVELHPDQARCATYQKEAWWAMGVPWTLIVNGKEDYTYDKKTLIEQFGHPYYRNPRTLLGQKADGTIVWVVVDGRSKASAGFTILHSSKLMKELGCQIAVNLDGGGSSEMIVDGKIKNALSGGCERAIGTALMAYGKVTTPSDTAYTAIGTVKNASTLNVRSGPGTSYGIIGSLKNHATVNIVAKASNGWYKIAYGSGYGYVSGTYIAIGGATSSPITTTPPETTKTYGVTTAALRLRTGASTKHSIITTMPKGTRLALESQTNGWYKVTYNGKTGYCSGSYIKIV